jgi:hypothetical protein
VRSGTSCIWKANVGNHQEIATLQVQGLKPGAFIQLWVKSIQRSYGYGSNLFNVYRPAGAEPDAREVEPLDGAVVVLAVGFYGLGFRV